MLRLKTDMHIHTAEDPFDHFVTYSARELIDRYADAGYDVLSITCHNKDISTPELTAYAAERGLLYIPGLEATIGGRHVLIYGAGESAHWARSFDDVRDLRAAGAFVVAPHPFHPSPYAVGPFVHDNADCFDALEHTSFYFGWANFNKKTEQAADALDLPVLGSSDMHYIWQFNKTYSYLTVDERSPAAVFDAIRAGRIEIVTSPLTLNRHTMVMAMAGAGIPNVITARIAPTPPAWV